MPPRTWIPWPPYTLKDLKTIIPINQEHGIHIPAKTSVSFVYHKETGKSKLKDIPQYSWLGWNFQKCHFYEGQ